MTKLEGYRCDKCKVESKDSNSKLWHQVQSMRISHSGFSNHWEAGFSEGLHYCSKECLIAAINEDWK